MSKSCQEKSQIPLRGFGCSSPWCCWLADGRGRQLGWWLGCSLLPCQRLGAVSPLAPLGPEVTAITQGSCLLINLPGDCCLSPSWLSWREPKVGGLRRLGALPSACPGRGLGQSCIPRHQVQAHLELGEHPCAPHLTSAIFVLWGTILNKPSALHFCRAPGKGQVRSGLDRLPGAFKVPTHPSAISRVSSVLLCCIAACCFCKSSSCLSLPVLAPRQHVPSFLPAPRG